MIDNLVAGAVAGTTVDFLLFPLDTLKTRLQSKQGFQSAGGFTNIYRGLSSCIAGSAPSASMFFVTYEYFKTSDDPLNHMWAASLGEMMACLVRVPTEIVKQRMQVGMHSSVKSTLSNILKQDGFFGLYRGYLMTVFREIPFSSIQFPLYERLKLNLKIHLNREIRSYEAGCCGAIAGATAAALTTPLDVIKTRLMLSSKSDQQASILRIVKNIYATKGAKGFFSGIGPRVMWISIGGSIFLGTYEGVKSFF